MATGNSCADFNGVTSVNYGDIDLLEGASSFTIDYWLWLDSTSAQQKVISEWDLGNQWLVFSPSATDLQFIAEGVGTRSRYGTATGVLSSGSWQHISIVWIGAASWKLYFNGADTGLSDKGSFGTVTTIQAGANKYSIGAADGGIADSINGRLAHIHVYDRALSFEETEQIRWEPYSITSNLLSYIPCYNAGTVICRDFILADDGTINGANLSESPDGPPVFLLGGQ